MSYSPPTDIWEVDHQIRFYEPLDKDDPRHVSLDEGRGSFSLNPLLRSLGVNPRTDELMRAPDQVYGLFLGHRGCGKSTELRRLARRLSGADRFFVVFLDVTLELDPNDLNYADVLLALAKQLIERLEAVQLRVDPVYFENLEIWFDERIEKNDKTRELVAQVRAGAQASAGLPLLGKLFAELANTFKISSTHREELRRIVKNTFSQFAQAFGQFLEAVEREIVRTGKGKKLLFIIDGTDRLSGDDSKRFFIQDVHQLQLIRSNFLYCAPIHLIYEGNQVQQSFEHHVLPMVTLAERDPSAGRFEPGYGVLREMIFKRADRSLFDSQETMDRIIEYSGGNPREVLRLMHMTFQRSQSDLFDAAAVDLAIKDLATDYKRILESEDYKVLYEIDHATNHEGDISSEVNRRLLYNLAMLEYNSFWRRSHPVVRELPAYKAQQRSS